MYKMKKAAEPKKVVLNATQVAVAKNAGVSTREYAERVWELTRGRPKRRLQGAVQRAEEAVKEVQEDIIAVHHTDMVNHPPHYKSGGIETIDFIEAKELSYHLGNVVKYVSRADHKGSKLEDLKKAQWYLNRAIEKLN